MPAKGTRATGGAAGNKMSSSDAARIQSTQAKNGGDMGKGGFPARSQAAAVKNANATPAPAPVKGGKGGKSVS